MLGVVVFKRQCEVVQSVVNVWAIRAPVLLDGDCRSNASQGTKREQDAEFLYHRIEEMKNEGDQIPEIATQDRRIFVRQRVRTAVAARCD